MEACQIYEGLWFIRDPRNVRIALMFPAVMRRIHASWLELKIVVNVYGDK